MYNLDKITVKELYEKDRESFNRYMELEKIMKVNDDRFSGKRATELGSLSYGDVAKIKMNLQSPTFENIAEIFKIVYRVSLKEYLSADVVDYFYALKWIKKHIRILLENERKLLSSDPDPMMEMAGVKRLQAFGELSTLITLGRQFGKTPNDIEEWKYSLVFSILVYDKIYAEVHKNYRELNKK